MTDEKILEISKVFGKKVKAQKIFHPNIQDTSEKTLVIDKRTRIREYTELISIEILIDTTIALAINKPDKICLINKKYEFKTYPYSLYCELAFAENPDSFLQDTFLEFVGLKLTDKESIVIYKNQLNAFVEKTRDFSELICRLQKIIEKLPNAMTVEPDLKGLPLELEVLVPLTKKWAISDDESRNELIDSLDFKVKNNIVTIVEPLINNINIYLESFKKEPMTEIAQRISSLMELYAEIKTAYNKGSIKCR